MELSGENPHHFLLPKYPQMHHPNPIPKLEWKLTLCTLLRVVVLQTPEFNPEAARFQIVPMDFEHYLFEKLEKSTARTGLLAA